MLCTKASHFGERKALLRLFGKPIFASSYLFSILCASQARLEGIWLSLTGKKIAAVTGWGESFVGTLFLAAATSLPELVVSVGALRLGAADMAVSNLLGSNLFNMVMIAVCDILYRQGPLLACVSPASVMAGLTSLVMTGIVITALIYRTRSPSLVRVGGETVALLVTYIAGNYLLFILSSR
jgi:cation:H+ antiporter